MKVVLKRGFGPLLVILIGAIILSAIGGGIYIAVDVATDQAVKEAEEKVEKRFPLDLSQNVATEKNTIIDSQKKEDKNLQENDVVENIEQPKPQITIDTGANGSPPLTISTPKPTQILLPAPKPSFGSTPTPPLEPEPTPISTPGPAPASEPTDTPAPALPPPKVNNAPSANISANVTSGAAPLSVSFSASGSIDKDEDNLVYQWTFGDGEERSGFNISHIFTKVGTYTTILSVSDGSLRDFKTITITVIEPPKVFNGPIFGEVYEVTDSSKGHLTGTANPESTSMVQVGNKLYFIYLTSTESGAPDNGTYVREFDLTTNTFSPAVRVFDTEETAGASAYHEQPLILRDNMGNIHPLSPVTGSRQEFAGTYTFSPAHRTIKNLYDSSTWASVSGIPGGVRKRINDFGIGYCAVVDHPNYRYCGAQLQDPMGVYDSRSGVTHISGEGAGFYGLDGIADTQNKWASYGIPMMYWRLLANGSFDGPYVLVEASAHMPEGSDSDGGNVFTQGDIVLGSESEGQRSLHIAWTIRNSFGHRKNPNEPESISNPQIGILHNYNIYYARSDDGGTTWRNLANTKSRTINEHIVWNDSAYLAVESDLVQDNSRSWGVDSNNNPFFVYSRHVPGTGEMYFGHVNHSSANVRYDMAWKRWTGSGWESGIIDTNSNYKYDRSRVRTDLADNIWVFNNQLYKVSRDKGASWSDWTTFTTLKAWRDYSYPDIVDPNYQYIVFKEQRSDGRNKMYFTRVQLTDI